MKPLKTILSSAIVIGALLCVHTEAQAEDTSKDASPALPPIKWGAFLDYYYGYDFNGPSDHERAFVTQPKRSNEFNVNLAYIDASINTDQWRGRLALQAGTSVQANYASEPTQGATSGPSLSRNIQEAFVGYRVSDKLWIDAGTSFSYIGFENWVSWGNWNYTRSLDAEFTPYYQSGVKATYQFSEQLTAQLNLTNGWQTISADTRKSVGIQLAYTPNQTYNLTYNNFFGEAAATNGYFSERIFNQLIGQINLSPKLQVAVTADIGSQATAANKTSQWWNGTVLTRYQMTPKFALAGRLEYYSDPDQVIVATSTPNGFQTWGASVNLDDQLNTWVMWRSEFRWLQSRDSVFSGSAGPSKSDPLVATSLAMKF